MSDYDTAKSIFTPLSDRLNHMARSDATSQLAECLRQVSSNLIEIYALLLEKDKRERTISVDDVYELLGVYALCMKNIHNSKLQKDYVSTQPLVSIYDILDHLTKKLT
jgi:hypothetical protein